MLLSKPAKNLIEPVPIQDTFCTKLAAIEVMDGNARFILASEQTLFETGETVLVIQSKLVMPLSSVPASMGLTALLLLERDEKPQMADNVVPMAV